MKKHWVNPDCQNSEPTKRTVSISASILSQIPRMDLAKITQPMIQSRPNPTELRSMDSYIQILCRSQKSKQKIPPLSLPCTKKSPFTKIH
jgi:hypothetical protein